MAGMTIGNMAPWSPSPSRYLKSNPLSSGYSAKRLLPRLFYRIRQAGAMPPALACTAHNPVLTGLQLTNRIIPGLKTIAQNRHHNNYNPGINLTLVTPEFSSFPAKSGRTS
jgi:hypothetical protein